MSKFAFLMPGQGAQSIGMGKAFYDNFPEAREFYKQANSVLGYDLSSVCFEGTIEELTKTKYCQPALFTTSLASFAAFYSKFPSVMPVGAAGLSLGELSALAASGAMSFSDGLNLVRARAEAMQECVASNPGAMLAVLGSSIDVINQICEEAGVIAANINSPDQVVLSGGVSEIAKAQELAKARGIKRAIRLEVAGAFHSPFMQSAADKLKKALDKISFNEPRFPVFSNVTARPIESRERIAKTLVRQIVSPVLWDASIRSLISGGADTFLEFAPAKVLTGLMKRIDPSVKGIALDKPDDFAAIQF